LCIVYRLTTIQRLDRINKAHRTILKKKHSIELLKSDFVMGIISFIGYHIKEDHKVQAFLVWIVWFTLAAVFYTVKMQISFYKGMFVCLFVCLFASLLAFILISIRKMFLI
jgi:hypothetical protein